MAFALSTQWNRYLAYQQEGEGRSFEIVDKAKATVFATAAEALEAANHYTRLTNNNLFLQEVR